MQAKARAPADDRPSSTPASTRIHATATAVLVPRSSLHFLTSQLVVLLTVQERTY
jgi:hypothetical protein